MKSWIKFSLVAILSGSLLFFYGFFAAFKEPIDCAFCLDIVLENQKFYEDDKTIALCTHRPITPGHVLIISKRHVKRFEELNDDECLAIAQTIKKVHGAVSKVFQTNPYILHEKNGSEAGQSVYHVHFHYIPLKKGQSFWSLLPGILWAQIRPAYSFEEMRPTIEELKNAMKA